MSRCWVDQDSRPAPEVALSAIDILHQVLIQYAGASHGAERSGRISCKVTHEQTVYVCFRPPSELRVLILKVCQGPASQHLTGTLRLRPQSKMRSARHLMFRLSTWFEDSLDRMPAGVRARPLRRTHSVELTTNNLQLYRRMRRFFS